MVAVTMHSWQLLPPTQLRAGGKISDAFLQTGTITYQEAAKFVCCLPYHRNSCDSSSDSLVVLREKCGTCSTKHALLRRLAAEQDLDIALVMGIFEMNGQNTPGVRAVLANYDIAALPEAHCYLRWNGQRIDVTRKPGRLAPSVIFLCEEDIAPEQIGDYKVKMHREFLARWITQTGAPQCRTLEEVWRIREECIQALSAVP